jgi:hypothetical protein
LKKALLLCQEKLPCLRRYQQVLRVKRDYLKKARPCHPECLLRYCHRRQALRVKREYLKQARLRYPGYLPRYCHRRQELKAKRDYLK